MRHATALLIVLGALALGGPAWAIDTRLAKSSVEEIKSVCAKVGGAFTQDAGGYGCGTDCHGKPGTACIVNCKPDQRCVAQMSRGKRPHSLINALQPSAKH
jgi:hypothetical protein